MKRKFGAVLMCALAATLIVLSTGCNRDNVKVYHVDDNDTATPATMPTGMPAPDNSSQPPLQYALPDGWEQKAPSQMRVASFGISENGKTADVSVIPLGGMAGNDPANVNRWRGQVGLASVTDDDISKLAEKVAVGDAPADLYDLAGTSPENGNAMRILGVILHRDDTAWFFKMTGDVDLVEKQKPAFVLFLKSVQFGTPIAGAAPATDIGQLPPAHPPVDDMNSEMQTAGSDASTKPVWTVPADWQIAPLTEFLLAKFAITNADDAQAAVNVSSLADDGGGVLANVNRWRGQLGLAPVEPSDLDKLVTALAANGSQAALVDFTGTNAKTGQPARLVGVVLPLGGQTWFYKLMGDVQIVAQQKDAFIKFVQSAKYPDVH